MTRPHPRRVPSLVTCPPDTSLPAIPVAQQQPNPPSRTTSISAYHGNAGAARAARSQYRTSNFFRPTIESDEEEEDEELGAGGRRHEVDDESRPSSASSTADLSCITHRFGQPRRDEDRHEGTHQRQRHPRDHNGTSEGTQTQPAAPAALVNGNGNGSRATNHHGDDLATLLFHAHEACVQAQGALAASKEALEAAMATHQRDSTSPPRLRLRSNSNPNEGRNPNPHFRSRSDSIPSASADSLLHSHSHDSLQSQTILHPTHYSRSRSDSDPQSNSHSHAHHHSHSSSQSYSNPHLRPHSRPSSSDDSSGDDTIDIPIAATPTAARRRSTQLQPATLTSFFSLHDDSDGDCDVDNDQRNHSQHSRHSSTTSGVRSNRSSRSSVRRRSSNVVTPTSLRSNGMSTTSRRSSGSSHDRQFFQRMDVGEVSADSWQQQQQRGRGNEPNSAFSSFSSNSSRDGDDDGDDEDEDEEEDDGSENRNHDNKGSCDRRHNCKESSTSTTTSTSSSITTTSHEHHHNDDRRPDEQHDSDSRSYYHQNDDGSSYEHHHILNDRRSYEHHNDDGRPTASSTAPNSSPTTRRAPADPWSGTTVSATMVSTDSSNTYSGHNRGGYGNVDSGGSRSGLGSVDSDGSRGGLDTGHVNNGCENDDESDAATLRPATAAAAAAASTLVSLSASNRFFPRNDTFVAQEEFHFLQEGQVIPSSHLDETGEFLLLNSNEKIRLVEIPTPTLEPQYIAGLPPRDVGGLLRRKISLERITEECDGGGGVDADEDDETHDGDDREQETLLEAPVQQHGGRTEAASSPSQTLLAPKASAYADVKSDLRRAILAPHVTPPLLPNTPSRHLSLEGTHISNHRSPRSTQVLASLIGDHQSNSPTAAAAAVAVAAAAMSESRPQTGDGRRSLDSSPTLSALARRERLISTLSESLRMTGMEVSGTIRHLERQHHSLGQYAPSTSDDDNTDRLACSHWSSSTSQWDTEDSALGFQLRSDLARMRRSEDDSRSFNVSECGLGLVYSESFCGVGGGREDHSPRSAQWPSSSPRRFNNGECVGLCDSAASLFGFPREVGGGGDERRSPADQVPSSTTANLLLSMDTPSTSSVPLLQRSHTVPATASTESTTELRARRKGDDRKGPRERTDSGALRIKLSKALFADRPRGRGGAAPSSRGLSVDVAQANASRSLTAATVTTGATATTTTTTSGETRTGTTVVTPNWLGRQMAKVVGQRKSDPKLHDEYRKRLPPPLPTPEGNRPQPSKSPQRRLFERVRKDSITIADEAVLASNQASRATMTTMRPPGLQQQRRKHKVSDDFLSPPLPPPRTPSAPPQLDIDFDSGSGSNGTFMDLKGKTRAVSPDDIDAIIKGLEPKDDADNVAPPKVAAASRLARPRSLDSISEVEAAEFLTAYGSDSKSSSTHSLHTGGNDGGGSSDPALTSPRSSMATITLTPKASFSDLPPGLPPSFPELTLALGLESLVRHGGQSQMQSQSGDPTSLA